jgi:hypothetical protein
MIQRLLDLSIRGLFGGARTGRPIIAGLSAGTALITYLVKHRGPAKQRLYGVDLKEGESIQIAFKRDGVIHKTDFEG